MVIVQRRRLSPFWGFAPVRRRTHHRVAQTPARPAAKASEYRYLPVDVYSTDKEYVIRANLPGVEPDETEITLEGDALTIKAKLPERLENVDYTLRERDSGEYGRTLRFRVPVVPEATKATFENGVLTLAVPKVEEAQPKRIEVRAH